MIDRACLETAGFGFAGATGSKQFLRSSSQLLLTLCQEFE